MNEITNTNAASMPLAPRRGTEPGAASATPPETQSGAPYAPCPWQRAAVRSLLESQHRAALSIGPLAQGVEQSRLAVERGQILLRLAQHTLDKEANTEFGDRDLVEQIRDLMARLQGTWLDRYAEVLGKYVALFGRITKALNELQHAITETDKDGNFIVDFSKVIEALESIDDLGLGGNFASEGEANAFLEELGVEWFEVAPGGPPYQLQLKAEVITDLIAVFQSSKLKLTPTEYNSLTTSKDNLLERLMHMNRVLPDKNQRMLDLWNTLVKTLSGTIDSLNESRTRYVNNLI